MTLIQSIRKRLYEEDPHCIICGKEVILPLEFLPKNKKKRKRIKLPDNMATIEHIITNRNPLRKDLGNFKALVLACNKCNCDRNTEENLLLHYSVI